MKDIEKLRRVLEDLNIEYEYSDYTGDPEIKYQAIYLVSGLGKTEGTVGDTVCFSFHEDGSIKELSLFKQLGYNCLNGLYAKSGSGSLGELKKDLRKEGVEEGKLCGFNDFTLDPLVLMNELLKKDFLERLELIEYWLRKEGGLPDNVWYPQKLEDIVTEIQDRARRILSRIG